MAEEENQYCDHEACIQLRRAKARVLELAESDGEFHDALTRLAATDGVTLHQALYGVMGQIAFDLVEAEVNERIAQQARADRAWMN